MRLGCDDGFVCVLAPGRVWPWLYDVTMRRSEFAGLAAIRVRALRDVTGRTLELGAGTGANLSAYPATAGPLVLTEPDPHKARRLRCKARRRRPDAQVSPADATSLPFPDESFDTVVVTLVLCTVPNQAAALAEIHRVLRPGGRFVFVEHVRSDDPHLARRQDRWQRPWSLLTGGCQPNRDTVAQIERAGFRLEEISRDRLPKAPAIVRPLAIGVATRSGD